MNLRLGILVGLVSVLAGCFQAEHKSVRALPTFDPTPRFFKSCEAMAEWKSSIDNAWNSSTTRAGSQLDTSLPSVTNIQVAGVDEADIIKARDSLVFHARSESVEVLDADTLEVLQTLRLRNHTRLRLYLSEDRLVILSNLNSKSYVTVFSIDGMSVAFEKDFSWKASMIHSRLHHGKLVVVSLNYAHEFLPHSSNGDCRKVQEPLISDLNTSLTEIRELDLNAEVLEFSYSSIIAQPEHIYATNEHLYILTNGYNWFWQDTSVLNDDLYNSSVVAQFDLSLSKSPVYSGAGVVKGYIRNSWAFHEKEQSLFVATTLNASAGLSNRLSSLDIGAKDYELQIQAVSQDFGKNEDIRAVRYIGDFAYVVTFEKTDPLFVIDIANPSALNILSELKIPGFSAYLHPVGEEMLMGVGYGAVTDAGFSWMDGIQLSLFDYSNKGEVKVVEQIEFGGRGSHVMAGVDHHAFDYNSETGVVALPVQVLKPIYGKPWEYSDQLEFSGAFLIDLNLALSPTGLISHSTWIPFECRKNLVDGNWWSQTTQFMDIDRVVRVNGKYLSFSPFGVKKYSLDAPFVELDGLKYSDANSECERLTSRRYAYY